jgi:UDPglucose 6-dehydrogenase
MKIAVIGTGYVGLVSGACLAELGKNVTCVDSDVQKISTLKAGRIPIYEPGLELLVQHNTAAGRLHFTSELKDALIGVDVVVLAVGTPTDEKTGRADLSYVFAAAEQVAKNLDHPVVVVTKSTVPVGTGQKVKAILEKTRPDLRCQVASNPEFLREGSAVEDFLRPDRIIIGADSQEAKDVMMRMYVELTDEGYPVLFTNIPTAELIKYASNAFLATKIAFTNEMADICEGVGADIEVVVKGMGMDARIGGKYMHPGPGYGGSCFPKDTLALTHIAKDAGWPTKIVESVVKANHERKYHMVKKIQKAFGGKLKSKQIAVLGLTFKANTDDMRYSPALVIVPELAKQGAVLRLYDPVGLNEAQKHITARKNILWCGSCDEAVAQADGIVILTEWEEFVSLDLMHLKKRMRGNMIVDLRNILHSHSVSEYGFKYVSIGRETKWQ